MGLFGNWFKGKLPWKAKRPDMDTQDYQRVQERTARYDPVLISNLRHDHSELVAMYGQLGQDVRDGYYQRIPNALLAFSTRLEAHLLMENRRFYSYVEQVLAGDSDRMEIVRAFRGEMNSLARSIIEFARRYQQTRVDGSNTEDFLREYNEVGKLLVMRIEREEGDLYPLYAP
jgi:regulator of sigma D